MFLICMMMISSFMRVSVFFFLSRVCYCCCCSHIANGMLVWHTHTPSWVVLSSSSLVWNVWDSNQLTVCAMCVCVWKHFFALGKVSSIRDSIIAETYCKCDGPLLLLCVSLCSAIYSMFFFHIEALVCWSFSNGTIIMQQLLLNNMHMYTTRFMPMHTYYPISGSNTH